MKKLLLITFLVSMLALSACTNSAPATPSTEESVAPTKELTQEPTARESISLPKIIITGKQAYEYNEDGTILLAESQTDVVKLEGEGYEAAAKTVDALFGEQSQDLSYLAEMAKEDYEFNMSNGYEYFAPYSNYATCEIARLDQNVLSLKCMTSDYFGGAHGMWSYWGATIDLKTGEELELIDLAVDSYALIEACTDYAMQKLAERSDDLFADYEDYAEENLPTCSWYLDASGIVFVYSPYEIGPYAAGSIEVCVPYTEVSEYMKPEYCGIQGDCIAMVQESEPVSFVTEQNRTRELIFEWERRSDYDYRTTLRVDNQTQSLGDYVGLVKAYLMHDADGKTFLLYTVDWASEDYTTYVYDLTGENMIETGNIGARLNSRSMGDHILSLEFRLDVLGTYLADMEYTLTEDGMLKPMEDIYYFKSNDLRVGLTTVKDLPVIIENEAAMLPAGTRLYVISTDNDGIIWFETAGEAGAAKKGMIRYIRDAESYRIYIEGIVEDEYFEMLPYVG